MHRTLKMSNSCSWIWLNPKLDFISNAVSNLEQQAWPFQDEVHPSWSWLQSYLHWMCWDISTGSVLATRTQSDQQTNHRDLTGTNVLGSFLHNHHTMLDHRQRIYAFTNQWKDNRCSWNWWHLFRAFLMFALVTVSLWKPQFTSSTNFSHLLHIWNGWACSFVTPEFFAFDCSNKCKGSATKNFRHPSRIFSANVQPIKIYTASTKNVILCKSVSRIYIYNLLLFSFCFPLQNQQFLEGITSWRHHKNPSSLFWMQQAELHDSIMKIFDIDEKH